jgi:hypothetical protein
MGFQYETEQEIYAVVNGFEQCTTAADEFKHREHLTVAVYYLRKAAPEQAFALMRSGLLRFLDHHGVNRGKFDEQVTRSWLVLVQNVNDELGPEASLLFLTNAVLERLSDAQLNKR